MPTQQRKDGLIMHCYNFYVSTRGNDDFSGTVPDLVNGDGPLRTIEEAKKKSA